MRGEKRRDRGGLEPKSERQLLGRAQQLQDPLVSSLTFFLDGAHSPESMEICGKWFCSAIHKANNTLRKNKNNGIQHILSSNGQETLHISDHGVSTSSTRVRSFHMRDYIEVENLSI